MARPKVAEAKREIVKAKGNLSLAASRLDCSRTTLYKMIDASPTLADAVEDARERCKDHVEDALMGRIDSGDTTAIIFFLKTRAKDRGYVERVQQEISGRDGKPIPLTWPEYEGEDAGDDSG